MIQKPMGQQKSSSKKKVYSNTILPQKTRKISDKQPNLNQNQLEKEEQTKPKVSRRKEIIKIREEINGIEPNETKNLFFEKIKNIGKPLVKLIRKKRGETHINRIRKENGEVITDTAEIQRIMRDYYKKLYDN